MHHPPAPAESETRRTAPVLLSLSYHSLVAHHPRINSLYSSTVESLHHMARRRKGKSHLTRTARDLPQLNKRARSFSPRLTVRHYSVLQDAVDETTTTTTATTKSTTTLPLEHASPNTQTLEVDDAPQARSKRRALDSPASSPSSRVPSSSSFSTSDVVRNLSTLPAEILLRVAELLEPRLSPFNADGSGGVSPSEEWLDPGRDLIQFSSTSRTIYIAVRSLVGRRFGIEMDGYAGGIEAEARVRSIVSNGEPGALPSFEEEQTSSNDFTRAKSVGQGEDDHADVQDNTDDESQPLPPSEDSDDFSLRFRRRPRFTVPGDRIRHFYVHIRSAATALHNQSATLAQSIRSMPRLESFACVFTNEETVTSSSPYALAVLGYEVLEALSTHPTLREIYLCGIKLAIRIDHFRDEEDPLPTFGPQLRSLVMSASHDTVLRLVPAMPGLKEVKLWRDFARGARIVVEDWWDKTVWEHLEHVELTGFSGTHGRPLLDKCMQALIVRSGVRSRARKTPRLTPDPPQDLRSTSPETVIPLRSLRLCEAYSYSNFVSNVLPSFSALPNLRSFTCMVWRDRHFGPQLLRAIAEHMPHLEELGVAVENSSLNWWPQQLVSQTSLCLRSSND